MTELANNEWKPIIKQVCFEVAVDLLESTSGQKWEEQNIGKSTLGPLPLYLNTLSLLFFLLSIGY